MNLNSNRGDIFWQPDDMWKPKDHIQFQGDFSSFTYEEGNDLVDSIALQYYPDAVSPILQTFRKMELAIANPPREIIEVQMGDKGILAVQVEGKTYHAEAVVSDIATQSWMGDKNLIGDYDSFFIVNYTFEIREIQIGKTTFYVVRCDMGDGTYAQLLMTQEEKQHFDQKMYMERRLREDAR